MAGDGSARVEDVGKINFFIYYEVGGETSKHSLQSSSTYGRDRPREQEWVQGACSSHPHRDYTVTQVLWVS